MLIISQKTRWFIFGDILRLLSLTFPRKPWSYDQKEACVYSTIDVSHNMWERDFLLWLAFLIPNRLPCHSALFKLIFYLSAAWHQINWPEADAAAFPSWRVPGAASWSHEFYRRVHSCGKGRQRYIGHLLEVNLSLHITSQSLPPAWLCIASILYSRIIWFVFLIVSSEVPGLVCW